ncbi:ABC transporter permease [Rhizobium helianthi]|uniref:ABC transporter permease n=1 Tax=Rhizobium helianthi TaxID=1132695 RepID=A0ABW4M2T7_9HYPH
MRKLLNSTFTRPWIWSWLAALVTFALTVVVTGGAASFSLAQATLTFATFSLIVGLGQMLVITLGPGNVDLSVPATITLSGTLALKFMDADPSLILPGLFVAIGIGIGVGIANYALIKLLRIPPIIATLSMSFLVQSLAIWSNRGLRIKPPEELSAFTTGLVFGIPNIAVVGLLLSAIVWWLLDRSIYGRWISAIGQSPFAARMAGIPVDGTRFVTYLLCAVLAALCGYLLASFSGGAALNMGAEYLLMSIAVVVIGGSAVAGGNSNVPGIWGASLFMFLVVSMLNTYGFGAGIRLMLTGLIIIAVIIAASRRVSTR